MAKKTVKSNRVTNAVLSQARVASLLRFLNPGLDINYEARYPADPIPVENYKAMFTRNGVARRVVEIWPEECWIIPPEVYETEDTKNETAFEKTWDELDREFHLLSCLKRVDILSGIGTYGVILVGVGDGKELQEPVDGIDPVTGKVSGDRSYELLYLKCFDESCMTINRFETSSQSPRYGMPVMYTVNLEDPQSGTSRSVQVHWTRMVHFADNRFSSEVRGEPRMKPVYNYLLDLRKIGAGSGEMFWRAGMSGHAWGIDPAFSTDARSFTDDEKTDMRTALEDYYSGLQRYMFASGLKPYDIAPQLTSPMDYVKVQVQLICITLGIPYRVFQGTEEGKLAGGQDRMAWLERVGGRQNDYVTPRVIRPFVKRLQAYGILPETGEEPLVHWPQRDQPSEMDVAETAVKKTEAMAKYVQGDVNLLMQEKDYLMSVFGMDEDEADAIGENVAEWERLEEPEPEPIVMPSPGMPGAKPPVPQPSPKPRGRT